MIYENFRNGINLGGWLSQYEFIAKQPLTAENLTNHFKTFINEQDIAQISSWKFDHVRVPLSGFLIYDKSSQVLNDEPIFYLDQCVTWCQQYHLNMIIDLHDIWGNVYGAMEHPMPLLTDTLLQDVFLTIWELLTRHYKNTKEITLLFELFNEVSDATGYLWNRLYKNTIKKIRAIDPNRWILVGSNCQNSVAYLNQLDLAEVPLVFYNFHYYDPQVFTHQKAHFSEEMKEFNQTITYPGDISSFVDFLNTHPQYQKKYELVAKETMNNKELLEKLLKYATDFVTYSDQELYCGEFGVINSAPPEEAAKWIRDFISITENNHIGHCLWNYKSLDFGLLDLDGQVISTCILDAVISRQS